MLSVVISLVLLGTWAIVWIVVKDRMAKSNIAVRHLAGLGAGFLSMMVVAALMAAAGILAKATPKPEAAAPPSPTANEAVAAVQPTAEPPVVPSAAPLPPEPADPPGKSMGSQAAFKSWFERLDVKFDSSPLRDGRPRQLGKTEDNLVSVEAIGYGDRLEQASLMFAVSRENPVALVRATGALMVFMRELGWEGGHKWVTDQMSKAEAETTKNGVAYKVQTLKELGITTITATPAGS